MGLFTIVLLSLSLCLITAYPQGAPIEACATLTPIHDQNGPAEPNVNLVDRYILSPKRVSYFLPGQRFEFSLKLKPGVAADEGVFKGIIMHSAMKNSAGLSSPYGRFVLGEGDGYQYLACSESNPEAWITHTNNDVKNIDDGVDFVWEAPASDCQKGKEYFISATVVTAQYRYQLGLRITMTCQNACQPTGHVKQFPKLLTTDFEAGKFHQILGWQNVYTDPACMFTHATPVDGSLLKPQSGKTYVRHITPNDGKQYVAIMRSPYAMQGCVCVHLRCRMFAGTGGLVRLIVQGNGGVSLLDTMVTGLNWVDTKVSMVSAVEKMTLLVTSLAKNGQVHIDNIEVAAGLCEGHKHGDIIYIN